MRAGPVVVVGLDGAEVDWLERWAAEGRLPNFARLRAEGTFGRLDTVARAFPACIWSCFFHGQHPGKADGYTSFPLVPGAYRTRGYLAEDDGRRSFAARARLSGGAAPRVAMIDIPKGTLDPDDGGVVLVNWGTHGAFRGPGSSPPGFMAEVERRFGKYPLAPGEEDFDVDTTDYYLGLRTKLLQGTAVKGELTRWLVDRDEFDLIAITWSELHAAGHRLYHFMDPGHPDHDPAAPAELKTAIPDVAAALDRALGDLMAALPGDATLVVCSLHGMMAEYTATDILPRFLERWDGIAGPDGDSDAEAEGTDSLNSRFQTWLRKAIPPPLRSRLKLFAPYWLRQNFRGHHYMAVFGQKNWARLRAFCPPSDDWGYVRVNLRGREPAGVVAPGAEYERLLDELTEEFLAFRDTVHGGPIVDRVERPRGQWPGPVSGGMPDLVVIWNCARPLSGIRTRAHGDIPLGTRLHLRTGFHSANGFVLARGPRIKRGHVLNGGHTLDLPPTILALMGAADPGDLDGQVLADLMRD
ncbi:MAG: alkaline phosphatase family protein [Hyphomicrobiales bacterium]|nr:alkaline phosphatase family protein [Hyphomicrobiales bacterium]